MIPALVHFRSANFARELLIHRLEAEVLAERRPPHLLDVLAVVHAARLTAPSPHIQFTPWRIL